MHKQSAEIDWKQLAEQRKTVNVQREIEIERLRARLAELEQGVRELADWWGSVAEEVKKSATPGDGQAAVARWHEAQVRALLNPSTSHETEETP